MYSESKKRVIWIICGVSNTVFCRDYIRQLKVLPLQSQYMFAQLMFMANNINLCKFCSDMHNGNTRHAINLYQPSSSLSVFKNRTFNMSTVILNKLPTKIKVLIHEKNYSKKFWRIYFIPILCIQYRNIVIIKVNHCSVYTVFHITCYIYSLFCIILGTSVDIDKLFFCVLIYISYIYIYND